MFVHRLCSCDICIGLWCNNLDRARFVPNLLDTNFARNNYKYTYVYLFIYLYIYIYA